MEESNGSNSEHKRRIATQKRMAEYRAAVPLLTDERLCEIVEEIYPQTYLILEVSIEVTKEMYRESIELTEENFRTMLKSLVERRKLLGYDIEQLRLGELARRTKKLVEKIYHDACKRTVYLSQYPEFDEELRQYFEEHLYTDGRTLAQKFFTLFSNYQFSGYPPFHSYSEPNGDIIFTKSRRTREDYDSEGKPIAQNTGCFSVLLFIIALAAAISNVVI